MAPPRKHDTDVILDAARTLVLRDGPRAVGVTAIATASGAPVGTLYHRFGNRDGLLAALWLRAIERFHRMAMAAADAPDPIDAALGMATATITFTRTYPDDARLLLHLRMSDLLDATPAAELREQLEVRNAPVFGALRTISTRLFGSAGPRELDAVTRAVVDLPAAVLRRHAVDLPDWLDADLTAAARALLLEARDRLGQNAPE